MSDYDVEILEFTPGPCPVCGEPGGNCRGDSNYHGGIVILPKKKKDPRATFRVPERVYEETQVGSRKVRKLLYSKGDSITIDEAKRLGLVPKAIEPKVEK